MNMQISRSSAQQSAASPQPCPTTGLRSPADVVVLVAIALATIPFLIANVVILLYRQRTYFRVAGGVDLILGSSVSGLIWIASSFVVGEHFYRRSIFEICSLWSFWLHLTFGLCLWLICVAMRLHRMQTLCNGELEKERRSQLWTWAVFIPLFLTPAIIFSVIATIKQISRLPEGHGILRRSGASCYFIKHWRLASFLTLPPFYGLAFLFCLRKLRGNRMFMLEYRQTCEFTAIAFIIYLLDGVLYLTRGQFHALGRCFQMFCVCSLVFSDFWLNMRKPVFLCLFKPKSEMDNFEARRFGSTHLTRGSMRANGVLLFGIPSSESALLQAIRSLTEEVESYKAMKEKLKNETDEYRKRIQELKELDSFSTRKKSDLECTQ